MTEIANNGERILLEKETPLMIARHLYAYEFAKAFIPGKEVLNIGSGEGYGTELLADFAQEVLGIDYDKAVIDYAKKIKILIGERKRKNSLASWITKDNFKRK